MPEFDWSEVNGVAVDRLRAPKVTPVPEPIVKQAQRSVDADKAELSATLVLRHSFKDEATAEAFVKFMRRAGEHTKPPSSMTVVSDPDRTGDHKTVAWKAGKRRGRVPSAA